MIGDRLSELRKNKGLKQADLGEILSLSKHTVSAYERGINDPPDEIKIKMAKFFGVSVDYLLGLTDCEKTFKEGSQYLELPEGFPKDKLGELLSYAEYLMKKH